MISSIKRIAQVVATLALLALVQNPPAQADVVTFGFATEYSGDTAQGTGPFLTANFADTTNVNEVLLTLQANTQVPEYITSLGFNVLGSTGITNSQVSGSPYTFIAAGLKIGTNNFDFGFDFRNGASPFRFDGTDTVSVVLSGAGLTAASFVDNNGGGPFAAFKIKDTIGIGTGIYSQSSVPTVSNPEASSLILGGMVSLLGVGFGWRRRNRTTV